MWEERKNIIYKPAVKTSQMQSSQETLANQKLRQKLGRIKLFLRLHIKVLEYLIQAHVMDDVEQKTLDQQWAKKLVKDKTHDVTSQDSD